MARRKAKPRPLPPRYSTRAKELAAPGRYHVDYDGPRDENGCLGFDMVPGIRDRQTSHFDPRPGMTRSALYAEVTRRNAGKRVSAVAQGIGRKPRATPPAARWVEFLVDLDETRAILEGVIAERRSLSTDEVRELMTHHNPGTGIDLRRVPLAKLGLQELPADPGAEQRLLESVSKQLERVLGIGRKRL